MAIQCRALFEAWSNGKGSGYGQGRLEAMFITACNMALSDMSYDADLATNIGHIATIDDSIGELDESYFHVVYFGLEYFGAVVGVRPADPKIASVVFDNAKKEWERAKGQYARSIDNANAPSQNDTMDDIGYLDV